MTISHGSGFTLVNCTFSGNSDWSGSAAVFVRSNSNATLVNCTLWGNETPGATGQVRDHTTGGGIVMNYSCIQGGWTGAGGVGIIDLAPRFVRDPGGVSADGLFDFGDLRLRCTSPCVDAGDAASVPAELTTDVAGGPRILGVTVDMGAFEGIHAALTIHPTALTIPEGGTATFTVALPCDPAGIVSVRTTYDSGDFDLRVDTGAVLTFDSSSFTIPQTITIAANEDDDLFRGNAILRVTAPGIPPVFVSATETDNDVGPILFVDAAASGIGNGSNWSDAQIDLQDTLTVARENPVTVSEIWVAAGTYTPSARTDPADPRSATFGLISGVALYGGFAGTETEREQRAPAVHITILSGDLDGNDNSDPSNTTENALHVVTAPVGTTVDAVLDGFTITGGNANGVFPDNYGGGIFITESATVRNCVLVDNWAEERGSGLAFVAVDGTARFEASSFVTHCTFIRNSVSVFTRAEIAHCSFVDAGVRIKGIAADVNDCTFVHGGVSVDGGAATIVRCRFVPGGVGLGTEARAEVHNSLIIGNLSSGAKFSHLSARNCTVIGNLFVRNDRSSMGLGSCIIWKDEGLPTVDVISDLLGISSSLVKGGWPGDTNIDADPLFVDPDGADDTLGTLDDDYRLASGSPAIDAGWGSPRAVDIDGLPRALDDPCTPDTGSGTGPIVDMGAFEFARQGDVDCDNDRDLADYLRFLDCYGGAGTEAGFGCEGFDLDADGDVDLADLVLFQAAFTGAR